jgi:hypothetical protein
MRWLIALVSVLVLSGCAGSFEEAKLAGRSERLSAAPVTPPSVRCISLDTQQRNWATLGAGAAVAAGASGATAIPCKDETCRTVLVSVAVGAAVTAAAAEMASHGASTSWARECSSP